jgi:HAMP domain-containing protein
MENKSSRELGNRRTQLGLTVKPTLQLTLFFHLCSSLIFLSGVFLYLSWSFFGFPLFEEKTPQVLLLHRSVIIISILFCLLGVTSFVLSATFSFRITGPMVAIHRMIDRLKKGEFSARVNLRAKDEFHDLAEKLNELAQELENKK